MDPAMLACCGGEVRGCVRESTSRASPPLFKEKDIEAMRAAGVDERRLADAMSGTLDEKTRKELKKTARLQRNRESARLSRKRKADYVRKIEAMYGHAAMEVRALKEENQQLQHVIAKLQRQLQDAILRLDQARAANDNESLFAEKAKTAWVRSFLVD